MEHGEVETIQKEVKKEEVLQEQAGHAPYVLQPASVWFLEWPWPGPWQSGIVHPQWWAHECVLSEHVAE